MAFSLDLVDDFFGSSESSFMEGTRDEEDIDVVVQGAQEEQAQEPAPAAAPAYDMSALESKLDSLAMRLEAKERAESADVDKLLAGILDAEEDAPELDLASVSQRAASAEALVLELATRQTATELAAAVSKYGVDREALLQAVIDSEGGDPDVLAQSMIAKAEAEEARVLARLQAKHPGIKDVLASGTNREARAGQDAPTLRGTPSGVPNKDGANLKRQAGESSSDHLARLMDAGAFQGF